MECARHRFGVRNQIIFAAMKILRNEHKAASRALHIISSSPPSSSAQQ